MHINTLGPEVSFRMFYAFEDGIIMSQSTLKYLCINYGDQSFLS